MSLSEVVAIAANLSVIAGIGLGLLQLRHIARQRQEEMVLRAYSPFTDPAFSRAFWTVMTWKYTSLDQLEAEGTIEDQAALDIVSMQFEMMGMLYHRGLARLELLDDLLAEPALMAWNRIAPIMYGYRAKYQVPGWSRWHEELAVALDRRLTELGEVHAPLVRPGT